MGDMVAADVSVTLDPREADFFAMATKVTFPTITFGATSGKAYPTGGIPLPAMGAFGMKKEIKRIFISPRAADGIIWKYDKVNHKLMAYVVGGAIAATIAGAVATGNLAQANVAVGAGTGNLTAGNVAVDAGTGNTTGVGTNVTVDAVTGAANKARVASLGITSDAHASTANTANVANRVLSIDSHTHTITANDVDAAMAQYANADMVVKVLDLMVVGS